MGYCFLLWLCILVFHMYSIQLEWSSHKIVVGWEMHNNGNAVQECASAIQSMLWFSARFPYMALQASFYGNCSFFCMVNQSESNMWQSSVKLFKFKSLFIGKSLRPEVLLICCQNKAILCFNSWNLSFIGYKRNISSSQLSSSREQSILHLLKLYEKTSSSRHKVYTWYQQWFIWYMVSRSVDAIVTEWTLSQKRGQHVTANFCWLSKFFTSFHRARSFQTF